MSRAKNEEGRDFFLHSSQIGREARLILIDVRNVRGRGKNIARSYIGGTWKMLLMHADSLFCDPAWRVK